MGMILSARQFHPDETAGLLKPIIYCCAKEDVARGAVSLNLPLAERLAACRPEHRTMQVARYVGQILEQLPENAVIKEFDVLFHPAYRLDVLRMLTLACKRKPFGVLWPGRYEDGKLFYAEEGYRDYRAFRVQDYDVTCIV